MKLLIIDGYVDEPTCLGVPPYISTYVRYTAGAAFCAGYPDVGYITIDELRSRNFELPAGIHQYDLSVIIAGNPVPGKYLGGEPIHSEEFFEIAVRNPQTSFFAGGPNKIPAESPHKNLRFISGDIESFLFHHLKTSGTDEKERTLEELNEFSIAGAFIIQKHPRFPDVVLEIETGRGCPRRSHCSFCIEGNYKIEFRPVESVIREIKALYSLGVRHFRIGKQADLFAYGSELTEWRGGFPKPNEEWIKRLYTGIRDAAPDIRMLHLDNVNPGTLANYPDESLRIAECIAAHNTPGDVAALGMESADPAVIKKNFLKATPTQVKTAIEILNSAGAHRENGIPKLLPGINLIRGLLGESRETFLLNYEFLTDILNSNLLLRRINIRQIRFAQNTFITGNYHVSSKEEKKLDAVFRNYREKIRREIDIPMIGKIFPIGTILPDLIVESHRGDWSIARQLATYPVAVVIPKIMPLHSKIDAFIIGYRERSLVGLTCPFFISQASLQELKQIPGLSKKAGDIIANKRYEIESLSISPIYKQIREYLRK